MYSIAKRFIYQAKSLLILFVWMISFAQSSLAFRLEYKAAPQNREAGQKIDLAHQRVNQLLPSSLSQLLSEKRAVASYTKINKNPCRNQAIKAYYYANSIFVEKEFFNSNSNCPDKYSLEILVNTLLHEVAHYVEDHTLVKRDVVSVNGICRGPKAIKSAINRKKCFYNTKIKSYPYSFSHYFKALNSFSKNKLKLRTLNNDSYELTSLTESFAENFVYFLKDPNYKCLRPLFYDYYQKHFEHKPYQNHSCEIANMVYSAPPSLRFFEFDSSRLYRIDYTFATKGEDIAGRWGHSMLRLIFCAPDRTQVDQECLKDTRYHAIVAFRANEPIGSRDFIGGLTGKNPSQLFVYTVNDIIKEYTIEQSRNLEFYPLNLNQDKRKVLLEKIKTLFWSYLGDYYFLTNNCAVETLDLLSIVISEKDGFWFRPSPRTPKGVLRALVRLDLVHLKNKEVLRGFKVRKLARGYKLKNKEFAYRFDEYILLSANQRSDLFKKKIDRKFISLLQQVETYLYSQLDKRMTFLAKQELIKNTQYTHLLMKMRVLEEVNRPWLLASDLRQYGRSTKINKEKAREIQQRYKKVLKEVRQMKTKNIEVRYLREESKQVLINSNTLLKKLISI